MSDLRRRLLMYLASQKKVYIEFEDPEVYRILLANISNDKKGITQKDIDRTKYLNTLFKGNKEIIIFNELNLFPLTILDKGYTFNNCSSLTEVSLPNELTKLTRQTFFNCSGLSAIHGIENVTDFGMECCYGCTSLNNFTFNEQVTAIRSFAFLKASGLTSLNLPNLTILEGDAFTNSSITEIIDLGNTITEFPGTLSSWGNLGLFYGCKNLTKAVLPEQLIKIGGQAFYGCTSLTDVQFNNNIQTIGSNAFTNTKITNEINLPNLTTLGSSAFLNTSITTITNLGNITSIGDYTFQGCKELTEVNLPSSLTKIGISAFNGCKLLSSINLENVTSIHGSAFKDCTSLTDVQFGSNLQAIYGHAFLRTKIGGILDFPNLTTLGENVFPQNPITEVKSLGSITKLPDGYNAQYDNYGVFWKCVDLTKVVLPETLTDIGSYTFYYCTSLTDINLPEALVRIGQNAFTNTKITNEINLPNLTTLGGEAFSSTSITKVLSLGNVTDLPNYLFSNCKNLIEINGENVSSIDTHTFANSGSFVVDFPNLKTIKGTNCFYNSNITEIRNLGQITSIPNGQNGLYVDYGVFHTCAKLTSVVLPETLTTIGTSAFHNCTSLVHINFPDSITTINTWAFYNCKLLEGEIILNNLNALGRGTFGWCSSITKVVLPSIVSMAGTYDGTYGNFVGCSNLITIDIGDKITSMGNCEFFNCGNLKHIIIRSTTPPTIPATNSLINIYTPNCSFYVPDESVEAYKTATNWTQYATKIKPLSEYVEE